MVTRPRSPDFLKESSARRLVADDLHAVFLPDHGMLAASLRYKGVEILRRVEDLEAAATRGAALESLSSIRGRTGFLSDGIVFWGKKLCSIGHLPFSISTSICFQCTVCHGLYSPG
jgi:hypothetical protein